jgi:hypothetical protein
MKSCSALATKCFVEYEEASSQTRTQALYTMKCFDVHEKKRRCFSPSAQKLYLWVSSTTKQFIHQRKGKIILQGMDKYVQCCVQLSITIFCKKCKKILSSIQEVIKKKLQPGNLQNTLRLTDLWRRHPADRQRYKVNAMEIKKNQGKQ